MEEDEIKTVEREIGPPLLTPLSEDATVDFVIPWTARQSSQIQPDIAVALIRSNIWPGAFAFTHDKYANVISLMFHFIFGTGNLNSLYTAIINKYMKIIL